VIGSTMDVVAPGLGGADDHDRDCNPRPNGVA